MHFLMKGYVVPSYEGGALTDHLPIKLCLTC
jgi:hypothetical protein